MRARVSWSVLIVLLAATLAAAATFDRRQWPGLVGDEATYLMEAQSLAWDRDFAYSGEDYRRFVALWHRVPEGLILQTGDRGRSLSFGKPSFYPLFLAPFVRLAPVRGPLVANALLLALAGIASALALRRRLGPAAPLWVAAFLFASVAFAYVFWVHADLFLMDLVAVALALAYGDAERNETPVSEGEDPSRPPPALSPRRTFLRWAAAGALLAVVTLSRPFYGILFLPVALATPRSRRRPALTGVLVGALALAAGGVALSLAVHGRWTSYGGERMGFYSYTGFPEVDFPVSDWPAELARRTGSGSWVAPRKLHFELFPRVAAWDVVYFLAGRHVGVLPYFLPALLGFVAFRPRRGRWALLVAVAVTAACFLYVRPFNFYGGGGSMANRYILPVYPAFWFLAGRRASGAWALLAAALAAPFLWPVWTAPRADPFARGGGYRYVSSVAEELLPYETTLDHLKPSGHEDVVHNGLWVKSLGTNLEPVEGGSWLELRGRRPGELLLAVPRRLDTLRLEVAPPAPASIRVSGARAELLMARPGGSSVFLLTLGRPAARHRMWWSREPVWLYRLKVGLPQGAEERATPLRFRLSDPRPAG